MRSGSHQLARDLDGLEPSRRFRLQYQAAPAIAAASASEQHRLPWVDVPHDLQERRERLLELLRGADEAMLIENVDVS